MKRSTNNWIGDHSNKRYNFFKKEGKFSELRPGHLHENVSNFKKSILRLNEAYQGPRTLGKSLSLRNLKSNQSLKTLNRTF